MHHSDLCLQDDPSEQTYNYEVNFCGLSWKNGKAHQKELTEEEKAEAEAKGGKI